MCHSNIEELNVSYPHKTAKSPNPESGFEALYERVTSVMTN